MTSDELAKVLQDEISARSWTVDDLADAAGVVYETARRAVRGIGSISLSSTNKLLVAVGKRITISEPTREDKAV